MSTDEISQTFLELLDSSNLATKKGMLNLLMDRIRTDESDMKQSDLLSFIDYIPNFVTDTDVLVPTVEAELNTLLGKASNKIASKWLSTDLQPYTFGNKQYDASDLSDYPGICKLLKSVNEHPCSTGDLNSCLVNRYNNHNVAGRLHADDENIISDSSSVFTVSFGVERTIDFTRDSKSPVVKTLVLEPLSAFVMRPGCQQVLKHRVNKGIPGSGVRFSISFRRAIVPPSNANVPVSLSPITSDNTDCASRSETHGVDAKRPLIIIAGDSLAKPLKPVLLGKNKIDIANICSGGYTIHQTEQEIIKFSKTIDDTKHRVDKIFLSVGANDIRYCYSRGVRYLKAPLKRLIQTVYELFGPTTKIYFQSLLPFYEQNRWTAGNVLGFNTVLKEICYEFKVFYINVFKDFLDSNGNRNNFLFKHPLHPKDKAMGLIAIKYIRILHPRTHGFDPEVF